MSDADDDEEPTILTVREYLSRAVPTRGTLPTAVQDALEDYLLNTLNILDGAQVEALGAEGLASVYAEAVGDGHSPALVGIVKRRATPVTHAAVAGLLSPSRGIAASGLTDKTKSTRKADPRTSQMTKTTHRQTVTHARCDFIRGSYITAALTIRSHDSVRLYTGPYMHTLHEG